MSLTLGQLIQLINQNCPLLLAVMGCIRALSLVFPLYVKAGKHIVLYHPGEKEQQQSANTTTNMEALEMSLPVIYS